MRPAESGFDYIGNEQCDPAVWKRARRSIGVDLPTALARKPRALDGEARLLPGLGGGPLDRLRALRPYQWSKNALVLAPLVALHETDEGYPRLGAFEAVREKAAAGAPPRFVSGLSRRLAP